MIVTKAVSRSARDRMDRIGWVAAPQGHDPPARAFFERGRDPDTISGTGGVILFIPGMVGQEERRMRGEANLLRPEWRPGRGRALSSRSFGYDKSEARTASGHRKIIRAGRMGGYAPRDRSGIPLRIRAFRHKRTPCLKIETGSVSGSAR